MSLSIQTTQEVSDDVVAQLELKLSQTIPLLPKTFTRVLAKVLAGIYVLLFKYCGFIFLQMFVQHATNEETTINGVKDRPLTLWGKLFGVGEPLAATRAELVIEVTVTNQTGNLAAGAQVVRSETGVIYLTTTTVALDDATIQVTMRASSDQDGGDGSGDIGNLEAGDIVSFANTPPNVATNASVVSTAVTGADAEEIEAYRARIQNRARAKPQGGAYADYRIWAEGVAGIVHAYPYAGDPGEIDVYIEATVESSGSDDGIPTGAQITAVAAAIELEESGLATRRPVNAAVNVLAITRTAFTVTVTGLADTADGAEEAIQEGADEYFLSREPFIVGLSVLPRDDRVTLAGVSGIIDGIANAYGGTVASVTLKRGVDLITSHTLGNGEKAKAEPVVYA